MTFAATLSVNSLTGANGFTIVGPDALGSGRSVDSAGDVNGDGFDDLVIGSFGYGGAPGYSYVVFGRGTASPAEIDLAALDGTNGFRLSQAESYSGTSVSAAGDLNGDGYGDLLVGTSGADGEGPNSAGDSYVVYGAAGGFAADLQLGALNSFNGFRLDAPDLGFDSSGSTVSSAGDVNNDGLDDILVSVTGITGSDTGSVGYVVFGSQSPLPVNFSLASLDGVQGFRIDNMGEANSVSGAGDINNDGIDDFIIGDSSADLGSGRSYVVFGRNGSFGPSVDLAALTGSDGFALTGAAEGDYSGTSVSSAGDVNGDGYDDLIVGATGAGAYDGAAYVVFGKPGFEAELDLGALSDADGFTITGTEGSAAGYAVSGAGDVNGDGYDDLLVAAPGTFGTTGSAYVVFGNKDGLFGGLANLDGTDGFRISDIPAGEDGGIAVAAAGDLNGDLLDDIIVGSSAAGESYVIYGRIPTGDPTLRVGSDADQTIHGSNTVAGFDYLYGEGGDDIIIPYYGSDQARGGDGIDILYVDYSQLGSVSFATNIVTSPSGSTTFYRIRGLAPAGGESSNVEYRDFERFFVIGSATANNSLRGGSGGDYLVGGVGSDTILTFGEPDLNPSGDNSGDDIVDIGQSGGTAATTGTDNVQMGGGGDDLLIVDWSAATEAVSFGAGSSNAQDYFSAGSGVFLGTAVRLHFTGVERFTVTTGSGNDAITTGANADTVNSGAGNDAIVSGRGRDTIDGGSDADSWSADFTPQTSAVILDLNDAGATTLAGGTIVRNIESLVNFNTGSGHDVLATLANGVAGDVINTGGGNDRVTLFSAATAALTGTDNVQMGTGGSDLLVVDWSAAAEAVNFAAGSSNAQDYFSAGSGVFLGNAVRLRFTGVERFAVTTGSNNDAITTGDNADSIFSGGGNDTLDSRAGAAIINGGAGIDRWAANLSASTAAILLNINAPGAQALAGGSSITAIEALTLTTGSGNDVLTTRAAGSEGDILTTGAGDDTATLYSAATAVLTGTDNVQMGTGGNDLLVADWSAATEAVSFSAGSSNAQDYFSAGSGVFLGNAVRLHFTGVERFAVTTGSGDDAITTGNNTDTIGSGAGNDHLDSRAGIATINGGAGVDRWAADLSAFSGAIALNLNLAGPQALADGSSITAIEALSLTTGAGNDVITTRAAGSDGDTLFTGLGDDTATLFSGANAVSTGTDNVHMGTGGDDLLVVNWSAATEAVSLSAGSSSTGDYFSAGSGVFLGNAVRLHFTGVERFAITTGSGNDAIVTGANADTIDGGSGIDAMNGGDGSDTYRVDDALDTVTEAVTGDVDRVIASVSYALAANAEVEILETANAAATLRIDLNGSNTANSLIGNAGANILDGGGAADRLTGGDGSDTYRVDHAGDRVVEGLAGDNDLVLASVSYRLARGSEVERLQAADLLATTALNFIGNEFDNALTGNAGANVLNGAGGTDVMRGGDGDDTYAVGQAADQVVEGFDGGHDSVKATVDHVLAAHVEDLRLGGSARSGAGNNLDNLIVGTGGNDDLDGLGGADVLRGGAGADDLDGGIGLDVLFGMDGNDTLTGGGDVDRLNGEAGNDTLLGGDGGDSLTGGIGRDTMTGGAGADAFFFDDGDSSELRTGADRVADFLSSDGDKINLRAIDANSATAADDKFSFIDTAAFSGSGTGGELRYQSVQGALFIEGDTDGDGAADFTIRVDGTQPLLATDFVL